ncbi:MAG: hypothetical protein QHH75_05380 [Bacillota bacterium]|nr:hypothetical protein [Bacillota bacterium]
MVKYQGLYSKPKYTLEATSDGKKTFVYFKDENLYLQQDTYINPQPGQLLPEAPPDAVIPYLNGTQIPFGVDIDLAVHPELLVQNKIFKKASVSVLGEEKIGERNALKIEIKVPDPGAEKLGDKQYYWIDTETGILLKGEKATMEL